MAPCSSVHPQEPSPGPPSGTLPPGKPTTTTIAHGTDGAANTLGASTSPMVAVTFTMLDPTSVVKSRTGSMEGTTSSTMVIRIKGMVASSILKTASLKNLHEELLQLTGSYSCPAPPADAPSTALVQTGRACYQSATTETQLKSDVPLTDKRKLSSQPTDGTASPIHCRNMSFSPCTAPNDTTASISESSSWASSVGSSPEVLQIRPSQTRSYRSLSSPLLPSPTKTHTKTHYCAAAKTSTASAPSSCSTPTSPPPLLDKHRAARHPARSPGGWRWMTVLLVVLQLLAHTTPTLAQVVGEAMRCHLEGEAVKLPREVEKDNSCISCSCQNQIVVCKKTCPSLEGCYWKMMQDPKQCCQICKGCEYEGSWYHHGARWSDGCEHYECQSGVLTVTQTQCHTPCYTPLPRDPHTCCHSCPGCWLEGRRVSEGEEVASRVDPCVRCRCTGGTLSCEKKACPVLSCPATKQVLLPDSCCKTCQGSRELITPPGGRCFLNAYLYKTGLERTLDPCTTCTCHEGYITCQRATCPVLNCSHEYQITHENECCPSCSAAGQLESACHMHGMIHKDGEEWKRDQCTSCTCTNGAVSCHTLPCEYFNKPCPPGHKRVESEHECCPRCEEAPGVCVVFGDPHYRTFDGLLFNFQGACKYTLAETCHTQGGFNLKVNNDARRSNNFSWTKSLTLKIPGAKVKLCQKLRTKIDGQIKKPPYEIPNVLNLTREGQAISITTPQGLRVLWDGISYVEVEVPVEMKSRTCGLCGNFNGDAADDLTTKDGTLVDTPTQMAMSWSTGRVRQCSRKMNNELKPENKRRPQRLTCPVSRDQALSRCGLLNSTVFQACHSIIPIDKFYQSCVLDMCECRSIRRCECDTLQAYARQCQRLGISIPEWRTHSKCGGLECPHGAEYMECAPPCRATCRNPTPNPKCYTRRCRAGCYCPPPTVLHRGACIPAEECRKSKKRRRNRRRNR